MNLTAAQAALLEALADEPVDVLPAGHYEALMAELVEGQPAGFLPPNPLTEMRRAGLIERTDEHQWALGAVGRQLLSGV